MNKATITKNLLETHQRFTGFIDQLDEKTFVTNKNEKWSPGQQLEHIYLSVKTVRQILSLPKFALKLAWGQSNRPGKTSEDLIKKYLEKLENGGQAPSRFLPKNVAIHQKQKIISGLMNEVNLLSTKMSKFTETELDKYVLPHPLLGKLTIREMMYFTAYHVGHHERLTRENL